jgi:hypothetical protein
MKTLSLKIPQSVDVRLAALARSRKQTKSALVRAALEAYLGHEKPAAGLSCLDLVADLVGCFEGPGDLSHHKRHLRGYGK